LHPVSTTVGHNFALVAKKAVIRIKPEESMLPEDKRSCNQNDHGRQSRIHGRESGDSMFRSADQNDANIYSGRVHVNDEYKDHEMNHEDEARDVSCGIVFSTLFLAVLF
jgi:hypothetical protein